MGPSTKSKKKILFWRFFASNLEIRLIFHSKWPNFESEIFFSKKKSTFSHFWLIFRSFWLIFAHFGAPPAWKRLSQQPLGPFGPFRPSRRRVKKKFENFDFQVETVLDLCEFSKIFKKKFWVTQGCTPTPATLREPEKKKIRKFFWKFWKFAQIENSFDPQVKIFEKKNWPSSYWA